MQTTGFGSQSRQKANLNTQSSGISNPYGQHRRQGSARKPLEGSENGFDQSQRSLKGQRDFRISKRSARGLPGQQQSAGSQSN